MKMIGISRMLLLIGALVLMSQPAIGRGVKARPRSAADAEFKTLIDKYYAAWSSLNADNADQMYDKDAGLVFYDLAPLQYHGWAEYKEGVKKNFFDNVSAAKLTPNNDLKVERRGNIAWTSVTFHLSATPKAGAKMELDGRHTAIWEKRGGKWMIVHEHVSAPLPG